MPYHSIDREVYHIYQKCSVGNNIESDKKKSGTGSKRPCKVCEAIKNGERRR